MATRIYLVRNNQTGEEKLVEATLPAQVLRHVAKSLFSIDAVKQADLVRLLLAGNKPEKAVEEKDDSGNDSQAGATGADATGGTPEGGIPTGDDASDNLGEGVVQPEAQAQEGFPADAGTEAASTGRKRR